MLHWAALIVNNHKDFVPQAKIWKNIGSANLASVSAVATLWAAKLPVNLSMFKYQAKIRVQKFHSYSLIVNLVLYGMTLDVALLWKTQKSAKWCKQVHRSPYPSAAPSDTTSLKQNHGKHWHPTCTQSIQKSLLTSEVQIQLKNAKVAFHPTPSFGHGWAQAWWLPSHTAPLTSRGQ